MALDHAILVSLRERPGSGYELAHRFERSVGFFWHASHQQIYRVLARMERHGWVTATVVPQQGRPDKRVFEVAPEGEGVLEGWLREPVPVDPVRSEIAVKLRGAAYGDRQAVLHDVRRHLAEHRARLAHYEQVRERDFPETTGLTGRRLDWYLVLRGGIRLEQLWVDWCTEILEAQR